MCFEFFRVFCIFRHFCSRNYHKVSIIYLNEHEVLKDQKSLFFFFVARFLSSLVFVVVLLEQVCNKLLSWTYERKVFVVICVTLAHYVGFCSLRASHTLAYGKHIQARQSDMQLCKGLRGAKRGIPPDNGP